MNNPNREVIEFLGDYGDTESLAKLEALRSAAENNNRRSDLHLISKAITRINSQHPSTALLEFIKQCSDPVEFHWALRRAKQHGLSHAQIRLAALEYRATLSPYQQRGMTDYAISQQIMTANDIGNLPSLPDSHVHDDVEFRTPSTAQLVGRPKTSPWRPNEANNEALGQWMTTIDWDNISEEQGRQLINQKLCELDLIPPDQCAALPTSQTTAPSPTSQPGPFPP